MFTQDIMQFTRVSHTNFSHSSLFLSKLDKRKKKSSAICWILDLYKGKFRKIKSKQKPILLERNLELKEIQSNSCINEKRTFSFLSLKFSSWVPFLIVSAAMNWKCAGKVVKSLGSFLLSCTYSTDWWQILVQHHEKFSFWRTSELREIQFIWESSGQV